MRDHYLPAVELFVIRNVNGKIAAFMGLSDELIEMLGENTLSQTEANKVIMAAREHWFENEGQEGGDERK